MIKEEKKAKQMRDKIKEKMGKKGNEQEDPPQEKYEKIGAYKLYTGDIIGEGSYGKVYKTKKDGCDQIIACKVISKAKLQNIKLYSQQYAEEMQKRFKTESEFHKQLSGCANIVKMIETIQNKKAYYFIMEYCQSDLSKVIKENGILTEEIALKYFSEMLEGYKSIYDKHAFHRDLKPENLLLKDDIIKISDFGFVKIFKQIDQQCKSGKNKLRTESKVGSSKYMAPDVLSLFMSGTETKTYNAEKSDIWSMGIILYKMLYGKEPYSGTQEQILKKINQKELVFPDTVELSPQIIKNAKVSPQIKKCLKKMIEKDEKSRINFKKLYQSIKSFRQKQVEKINSGIKQQLQSKQGKQGEAKNKKQQLLIFYNKLMVKIYKDATNYATIREIQIENYYQMTCKLMTLVHQKRTSYIENDEEDQVSDKIKQEISTYHNSFWAAIKNIANLKDQTLESLLLIIYHKIKEYEDFDLLMKEVEIFLIDLMLLLSLELKIVKADYVYTWSIRSENNPQKVILNYKQNTMTMLERKLNNQVEEVGQKHKKRKEKTREKEKRHKSKGKDKEKQYEVPQSNERLQVKQAKSKEKSYDKAKDKSSRQKRQK